MSSDIKVVALDLDGTLTNSEKKVTPATRAIIDKAREQGVKIVLASGRPHIGIKGVADELDIFDKGGYILSYNGGQILDCKSGKILLRKKIDPACFKEICEIGKKFPNVYPVTYDEVGIIGETTDYKYVKQEEFNCSIPSRKVDNLYEEVKHMDIVKFMVVGEHEDLEPVREYLQEKFPYELSIYYSELYFLEIMAPNIAKDKSLAFLLSEFGMSKENLMACGDGLNDLPMLEYAGLSVAMANACHEAKKAADFITKSNNEDGVGYAIEKFVL